MSPGTPTQLRHRGSKPPFSYEETPPHFRCLLYALQHVLTMLPGTVAVPLLIISETRLDETDRAHLISAVLVSMGIATLLQVLVGAKLPVVQGSSFAFIPSFYLIVQSTAPDGRLALRYITGAILLGAIFQFGLGFTGIVGLIQRLFSPVVTGPVILIIGLSLFELGAQKAGRSWPLALATFAGVFFCAYGTDRFLRRRFSFVFRTLPVLLTAATLFALCWGLTSAGILPPGHPAAVSFSHVTKAPLLITTFFLPWEAPAFNFTFFIAILAAFIAATVDALGSYHACTEACQLPAPTTKQLARGVTVQGLTSICSAGLGAFPPTTYSENLGLIAITRVASRIVILWSGVLLIFLGVLAKTGAILAAIPDPITGGLYCILFGMIAGMGIQQVSKADLSRPRNLVIVGFSTFMGLAVPAFVKESSQALEALSFLALGEVIKAIGSTGVAVTAGLGILLDNLLPGRPGGAKRPELGTTLVPLGGVPTARGEETDVNSAGVWGQDGASSDDKT